MYLIIDIGNTRVKTALYREENLFEIFAFKKVEFHHKIEKIAKKYTIVKTIIASVGKLTEEDRQFLTHNFDYIELDSSTPVPFINNYDTPDTLGVDRIALVAAAVHLFPKTNLLVIDAGTCITFDFVTANNEYLGGAISPGIQTRYNSLSDYTANLPRLSKEHPSFFIGANTNDSIHSGVVNGVCKEIDGVIEQYRASYKKLTIVLTGGDADFLSSQLKSSIFVRPFFLIEGLYSILKFNL
jgi:type III pantothenate kinase